MAVGPEGTGPVGRWGEGAAADGPVEAAPWWVEPGTGLLGVDSAEGARAALAAADGIRLFDRSTALWASAARLLGIAPVVVAILVPVWSPAAWSVAFVVALFGVIGLSLLDGARLDRVAGAEPRIRWVEVAAMVVVVVLALALGVSGADSRVVLTLVFGVLAVHVATPLLTAARRRDDAVAPWPRGSEAFAVLSVLAPARWVHPHRLAGLAGMPETTATAWVDALGAHGLVQRTFGSGLRSRCPAITSRGREQLAQWRAELEELAATR